MKWTIHYAKPPKLNAEYGDGKTHWPKIGMAFDDAKGRIHLRIDSLPVPPWTWEEGLVLYPVLESALESATRQAFEGQ